MPDKHPRSDKQDDEATPTKLQRTLDGARLATDAATSSSSSRPDSSMSASSSSASYEDSSSEYLHTYDWRNVYQQELELKPEDWIWFDRLREDFKCVPSERADYQYLLEELFRAVDNNGTLGWFKHKLEELNPKFETLSDDNITSLKNSIDRFLSLTTETVRLEHFEYFCLIRHYVVASDRVKLQDYFLAQPAKLTPMTKAALAMLLGLPIDGEMIDAAIAEENQQNPFFLHLSMWHWVAITNHKRGFELLCQRPEAKVDRSADELDTFWCPLLAAAHLGHDSVVAYLTSRYSKDNQAAINFAITAGHLNIAMTLCNRGASPLEAGWYKDSMLEVTEAGYPHMLRWLIGLGALKDPTAALHNAITNRNLVCTRILVGNGANIFEKRDEYFYFT